MKLLILIVALFGFGAFIGLPAIEAGFAVLLIAPIVSYLLAFLIPPGLGCSTLGLVLTLGAVFAFFGGKRGTVDIRREAGAAVFFGTLFLGLHSLCLQWSDFIAMGERLRDYSLLSSIIRDPVHPQEPWLAGYPMNYYVYWYRFGQFISTLLGYAPWETYHLLAAFALSFYATVAYRMLSRLFGFSIIASATGALLIALGSNAYGVRSFFKEDDNWWGPSRVVAGAINEFPAWSFLLGDLHPHFVNLGLVPFALLLFFELSGAVALPAAILGIPAIALWIFNSNPWEVPMWFCIVGVLASVWFVSLAAPIASLKERLAALKTIDRRAAVGMAVIGSTVILGLMLGCAHIKPEGGFISRVENPILRTTVAEMLKHFGVQLIAIAIGLIGTCRDRRTALLGGAALGASLFFQDAVTFLMILGFILGYEAWNEPEQEGRTVHALALAAVVLICVPEAVFLNDPYGGENERMNTIFKIYSAVWFPLGVSAIWFLRRLWRERLAVIDNRWVVHAVQLASVVILVGFFSRTIRLRRNGSPPSGFPIAEGLGEIERRFPGAGATIRELRELPGRVVMEGQGNAYDYTTFISTISGKSAFLGWGNHVNLLNKEYAEVTRREELTTRFYTDPDCARKREVLQNEKIDYAVLGPLEKTRYKSPSRDSFACLSTVIEHGEVAILKP